MIGQPVLIWENTLPEIVEMEFILMENLTNISLVDQVRATKVPTRSAQKFKHLVVMIVTTFILKVFVDQDYLIPESLPINKES